MQATITSGDLNNDDIVNQSELNVVLTNYWLNSPWVTLTNAAKLCDGFFEFALTNASAWNFSVEVTTNVSGTNWEYLTVAHPVYQFLDQAVTNGAPLRFYRLSWP